MTPLAVSKTLMTDSQLLAGMVPVLRYIIQKGYPLTQKTFVALNWFGDRPEQVEDPSEARVLELLPEA